MGWLQKFRYQMKRCLIRNSAWARSSFGQCYVSSAWAVKKVERRSLIMATYNRGDLVIMVSKWHRVDVHMLFLRQIFMKKVKKINCGGNYTGNQSTTIRVLCITHMLDMLYIINSHCLILILRSFSFQYQAMSVRGIILSPCVH